MTPKKKSSSTRNTLRYRAENVLKTTSTQVKKMSLPEIQHLVHELQVHQIELEMQNEKLRQTQLELQQARDRYADLYDFAPVGFLTLNSQGQILEANLPVCQLFGVNRKTLLRQKLEKFVMAADQHILRQHLHHVEQGHTKGISDVIHLKHNHSPHLVRLESLYEELGLQNLDARFRVAILDLTEQEQAKALQKDQEIWVGAMLDSAMDAIITIDDHQKIVLFNASAEHMFGCAANEALGQPLDRFLPQRFRSAHGTHIKEFERRLSVKKARMGRLGEVIGLRANGEEFPIEASMSKVTLENGVRFTVILRDITERVEALNALEASERRHRALAQVNLSILNAISAHIALVDANGVIVSVNESWKRFATANAIKGGNYGIGCNYLTVCDQAHGACAEEGRAVAEGLRAILAKTKKSFGFEYPCHAPHEERWFRVMITPISETENAGAVVMHLNITERRKIEMALAKEQQFIATILDTTAALVVILDPEWRIVRFNRVCENLTGRTIDEMRGKSFLDLTVASGEDAQEVKNLLTSFKRKQFPVFFENAWLDHDRQMRWISWSNTGIKDKKGGVVNIIATGIDITSRKQAELAMERLATQNRLLLDSAGEGIYGIDNQGHATFFNRAAEELTGWKFQEVEGRVIHSLLHHTRKDGTPYPWEECPVFLSAKHGNYYQVDSEILWRKDGTSFPVAYTCSPIRNPHNKVEGVVVTFKDITARKKAEAALQESEERFQAFMNNSPVVAFLKDGEGRYVYGNAAFQKLLNKAPLEFFGKTDRDLFPPQEARSFQQYDQETLKTGTVLAIEETSTDLEGKLHYWWTLKFPVKSKDGQVLLGGVALDITVRKLAEDALRQREKELQAHQSVLRALGGKLISIQEDERRRISRELHDDMNQRLAVLAFNIQSAQKGVDASSPIYQTLQKLYDGVSLLSDDVRHLAYQLHPSILDDLGLEVALRSFFNDFSKWDGIPVIFTATDLPVTLDQELASCLYRVVQECLRNVSRHAQATQVDVRLIGGVDGGVRLSIQDNGKGFGVKERKSGKHGLGLIGMEERVGVVQGTFELKSAPGQGTQITVWVPIRDRNS